MKRAFLPTKILNSQRGFNLISLLVGMSIVAIGAYMLHTTLRNYFFTQAKTSGKVQTVQVLSQVAADLHNFPVSDLKILCEAKSAFNTLVRGNCVQNDKLLDPSTQPALEVNDPLLEVRLNWDGHPDPAGRVCIEIRQCNWKMGNRILEVTLNGYFDKGQGIQSNNLTFRRVRW